jgi:hydroxyacylglutathione hydrolase
MLDIVPIPAFTDNYIWTLIAPTSVDGVRRCVVVDPGDAAPVQAYLAAHTLELAAILVTHHHADHIGGIAELTTARDIPVYGPRSEAIVGVNHPLVEGDLVTLEALGDVGLRVIEIPGHTAGHIAFVADDFVLCGDTLFAGGCGRLFEGTPAQMLASLRRLAALPEATGVYCTHEYTLSNLRFALTVEPENTALVERSFDERATRDRGEPTLPSTIAKERMTNPFLRCDQPAVRAFSETSAGRALDTITDVFAQLRAQKDVFR